MKTRTHAALVAGLLALMPAVGAAQGGDEPLWMIEATPQRPSFGGTAYTTRPGYLEFEGGVAFGEGDFVDVPLLFRLGLDPNTEVSLGFSPFFQNDTSMGVEQSFGDIFLGAKRRFHDTQDFDMAVDGFLKLPTADEDDGLGTGDADLGMHFIASTSAGPESFDFSAGVTFPDLKILDFEDSIWSSAASWGHSLDERAGFYGEVFVQFDQDADTDVVVTDWGVSYVVNPSFVIDTALVVGLTDDAPDWALLVGLTKVLGKVMESFGRVGFKKPE